MPRYYRELTRNLTAGEQPSLDVRTANGSVKVQGEDRTNVWVLAQAHFNAESEEAADKLMQAIADGISAEAGKIVAHPPDGNSGGVVDLLRQLLGQNPHLELNYELRTPRNSTMDLQLVNGRLDVTSVTGQVTARMVNGSFHVEDVDASLSLKHVNGHGEIARVKGDVELKTTNGNINLARTGGNLDINLVNGRLEIAEPGGPVSVRKVSGPLTLTGPIRGDISIVNAHGAILLNLPQDSRFELDARSSMGHVHSELEVRDSDGGAGNAPRVSLRSETGSIKLNKLHQSEPAAV